MKKSWYSLATFLFLLSGSCFACWQVDAPPNTIQTQTLNGQISVDGKPVSRTFALHRAITFDRERAQHNGAYARRVLKLARTDSNGMFTFDEVEPGRYWIVPRGARTLSDSIPVEVFRPNKNSDQRLSIEYHDDGCRDVAVEINAQTH